MSSERYFDAILESIQEVRQGQRQTIQKAARHAARTLEEGGCVHLLDHGHLLGAELVSRAGGLAALRLVTIEDVRNPALVRRGDVLFVASVSGRAKEVIESALLARERRVLVIALTSGAQAAQAPVEHESGKLLRDVADLVIDIGGVAGDALVTFERLERRACPSSGVISALVMWAVVAEMVAQMEADGFVPTIFTSANVPGGSESYQAEIQRYQRLGY
ncbi:MAG: sugar isomerase domain-containing protein [Bacillota bacterium]